MFRTLLGGLLIAAAVALPQRQPGTTARAPFGTMPDGTMVEVFTLTNKSGMEVRLISYGAIIQSIRVPDRAGRFADVVIGHDALEGYLTRSRFFGAVVGRYGNRIAKGRFTLDGREYTLAVNNGPNHLHGGVVGFDKVVWPVTSATSSQVVFSRLSPDGEEGYPGNLRVTVTYALSEDNALSVRYSATTDTATPLNLTQHSYFNLAGQDAGDIGGHVLTLNAGAFTPVDATQIPIGTVTPVAGTPFDFRKPAVIGERIDADHPQLKIGGGFDHNFVLERRGAGLSLAARLLEPKSGRTLEVQTTEPGIQFYSGNKLDGSITGKGGTVYGRRSGLCLETQHFPDSPNHANFPSAILRPGQKYESMTVFRFGVQR
ncbi:MAG TPA: aldose epimerase family protein [Vicinamibacterales bacterium]|nr:aldose epimerase family protein [Vicinamibacterales bacterium]